MYAWAISVLIKSRAALISEMKALAFPIVLGEQCSGGHCVLPSRILCKEFDAACTLGGNSKVLMEPRWGKRKSPTFHSALFIELGYCVSRQSYRIGVIPIAADHSVFV